MSTSYAGLARRAAGFTGSPEPKEAELFGNLYDRALTGERCWIRHDDGSVHGLPVHSWLGRRRSDRGFDSAIVRLCHGPTIDLGCGPGRLVVNLIARGVPALGVDQSATAVELARRSGAPALRRDLFGPLPGAGRWSTVLLADGNVGIGGDPRRVLRRARELLHSGGQCLAEFESEPGGIVAHWVRLESSRTVGPWFRWATVGIEGARQLADQVGLTVTDVRAIDHRRLATLVAA
jgi:SAM-dependent methyltransferase